MEEPMFVEVKPDASRIMEGLRDTGYEFNTAVADIVDNSIAAGATVIKICVEQVFPDDQIRVSVFDNGCGMSKDGLISAMRYGAPKRDDKHSLGKFGLGLKTASTSCCRRLKVCSREEEGGEPVSAIWDLDFIASSENEDNAWMLMFEKPNQRELNDLNDCTAGKAGTGVIWEKCDRVLSARYSNPSTPAFHDAFERAKDALRFHLAMTFQRFIDHNDARAANVDILLNGKIIEAWDPFCTELVDDCGSERLRIEAESGDLLGVVDARFFVVPLRDDYSTLEEKQRIMPSHKNEALRSFSEESLSGFYIYRENRLIHWGDWFGLPGVDFHCKQCRFELSFGSELDDFFQVDIKKSRIYLNEQLRKKLLSIASPIKKYGSDCYRRRKSKASEKTAVNIHSSSNNTISSMAASLVEPDSVVADGDAKARIINSFGITVVPYNIHEFETDDNVAVEAVGSLEDGNLWAPALINKKQGVQLNASHEFYQRFYADNKDNEAAVLAMDYVFWAMAIAENAALGEEARDNLDEARHEASRILRKLARNLPDVSLEDIEGGETR